MSIIEGDKQAVLARVSAVITSAVPEAVCELQDYDFRIGCGAMDRWGKVQETVMLRAGLDDETVAHHADRLRIAVKTGGGTAG